MMYPLFVNADIWLGAVTTLIGVGLGGVISLALNRQQMNDARVQRTEDDLRSRRRRSEDRRFDAYAQFSLAVRSYRDAIRTLENESMTEVPVDVIDALAKSVQDTSAIVFLIVESEMTYEACRAIVIIVLKAQEVLHNGDRPRVLWVELNTDIAELIREFQIAARDELEVGGVDRSAILARKVPIKRITSTTGNEE